MLKEVHYSKEFDEILTKRELLSVPRQVSRDIHCLDIASACTENDFPKLIQYVLHEDVDMKHIHFFAIETSSIPGEYIEPLLQKCSGYSILRLEVGFPYVYCNDVVIFVFKLGQIVL